MMTRSEKIKIRFKALSYVLVGFGGFSFISNHSDIAYGLTLLAGALDQFGPALLGVEK